MYYIWLQNSRQPINPLIYVSQKQESDDVCVSGGAETYKSHRFLKYGQINGNKNAGNGSSAVSGQLLIFVAALAVVTVFIG